MTDQRTITIDQGVQELFNRIQKLEAEILVDRAIISTMVATFAALPGVGIQTMHASLDRITHYADELADPDSQQVRVLQKAFREIPIAMKLKFPADLRSLLRVIDGDKE